MAVNVSEFQRVNVTDTCALWNVLSSRILYSAARQAQCHFACTRFVVYEALYKPRSRESTEDRELVGRLKTEMKRDQIRAYDLSIDDLQDVAALELRRALGKGELASIAYAHRRGLAFMTDDQGARTLAGQVLGADRVQTTPHLFGWLLFEGYLGDSDKDLVITEHEALRRPLRPHFEHIYVKALSYKLVAKQSGS